ncbi:MAG: class I SAM-dependent methyltransferase [Thermodesulfobacteriota bacterium]
MEDPFLEHKEPEEHFLPLSGQRYADFYALEMDGFVSDIRFYRQHCDRGSNILELGCGTGRISCALAAAGHAVVGLDLSLSMLKKAALHQSRSLSWVCMDMTAMGFRGRFDHILIPYNSLNLLAQEAVIGQCLQQSHALLEPDGSLLLQVHIPDRQLLQLEDRRIFQFQVFPLPQKGGKLIKETLRSYKPESREILLEERYRFRPLPGNGERKDYRHHLRLAAFSLEQWLTLLRKNGFPNYSFYGDYDGRPFQESSDSLLLIQAYPA